MTWIDYFTIALPLVFLGAFVLALFLLLPIFFQKPRRIPAGLIPKTNDDKDFDRFFKGKTFNIHLKSQALLKGVVLDGYSGGFSRFYGLQCLLIAHFPDGQSAYIRAEEIEYLIQQPETPAS